MDDARLRAVIREEIALAVKTLEDAANWTEADEDALTAIRRTVETFQRHYSGACEKADEQRARMTSNPFEEKTPDATTEALRDVLDSLRSREADPDHIARVEKLIRDREGSGE